MSKTKKNLIYQGIYQILIIILPILTAPYVSRVLGAKNIGYYSYSYSVANYFVLFCMLGINNYGNKLIAEKKGDKKQLNAAFSELYILHAIVSILVLCVYIIYINVTSDNHTYAMICSLYIIGAVFDINWAFFGLEEFKITVTRNTILKIATVCCVFIFVKTSSDTWKYVLIMALGNVISQSVIWIALPKYIKFVKPRFEKVIKHIKPNIVLFIPVIAVSVYKIMDKIMINKLSGAVQVGYYENAEKIINIPMGIITAVGVVMLPRAVSLLNNDGDNAVKESINFTMKYVMIIAYALAFGLIAIGPQFAPVFFGEEFLAAGRMIQGLAVTIPFMAFANIIRTQYLIPKEYNSIFIISVLCGAVINFIVNALFIKTLGANGAVIGTICAEISVCLIQAVAIRKELDTINNFKLSIKYGIIGCFMCIGIVILRYLLPSNIVSLLVEIIIGGLFYMVCVFGILHKENDPLIKEIVVKFRK